MLDDEERQRWRREAAGALETAQALAQAELVLQVTDGLWLQLQTAAADSESTDEG